MELTIHRMPQIEIEVDKSRIGVNTFRGLIYVMVKVT